MRTRLLIASLVVLLSACGSHDAPPPAQTPAPAPNSPANAISAAQLAQIDEYVQAQMSRRHMPGMALLVTLGGKPIVEEGYGLANIAAGTKVTPDTVFAIASVTKQFTATAIMLLVQDGKINLDDPITRYLPTAPQEWRDITIAHLLNHTSGFTRDFPLSLLEQLAGNPLPPPDALVTLASAIPREAPPGATHLYSNVGYHLLGFVVEKQSGMHFAEFLRQRVFAPLGMNTAAMVSAAPPAAAASGYRWTGTALAPASTLVLTPGLMEGEGGLRMSARDLAKWDAALLGESVLSRASLARMHTPTRLTDGSTVPYGFGWVIDTINQHPFTAHNGQLDGFRSQFARHSADGLAVIVLSNVTEAPVENIAARVAAIVKPQLDWVVSTDPQPALGQLLRSVADEVQRGALVIDDRFAPSLRALLTPELVATLHGNFSQWGPIEQLGYIDDVTLNGMTMRRYLLRSKLDQAVLLAGLDANGRLATLSIQAR